MTRNQTPSSSSSLVVAERSDDSSARSELFLPAMATQYLDRLCRTFRSIVADVIAIHPSETFAVAGRFEDLVEMTEASFFEDCFGETLPEALAVKPSYEQPLESDSPEILVQKIVANFRGMLQRILIALSENRAQIQFMYFSTIGLNYASMQRNLAKLHPHPFLYPLFEKGAKKPRRTPARSISTEFSAESAEPLNDKETLTRFVEWIASLPVPTPAKKALHHFFTFRLDRKIILPLKELQQCHVACPPLARVFSPRVRAILEAAPGSFKVSFITSKNEPYRIILEPAE